MRPKYHMRCTALWLACSQTLNPGSLFPFRFPPFPGEASPLSEWGSTPVTNLSELPDESLQIQVWDNWTRKLVMMEEDDEGEMQATTSEPEQLPRSTWSSNESILNYMTQIFPGRRWFFPPSLLQCDFTCNGGLNIPINECHHTYLFRTHYVNPSNLLWSEPNR